MNNTIEQAKDMLRHMLHSYRMRDENGQKIIPLTSQLPAYLEGPPGAGKTQICREIAQEEGIGFLSFSLTHYTRNSVLGLPVIKNLPDGQKYTEYTISEIIAAVQEQVQAGQEEGILLLDEFACMAESIFPIMLAFLQTRNIGRYTLPAGWMIVLCSNPPKYNKSSRKLDDAIMDRVKKITITFDADCFLRYAKEKQFEPEILTYLREHPEHIFRIDGDQLVTCRGWENLNDMLKAYKRAEYEINENEIGMTIKSEQIAGEFANHYRFHHCGVTRERLRRIAAGKWSGDDVNFVDKLTVRQQKYVADYMEHTMVQTSENARKLHEKFLQCKELMKQLDKPEGLVELSDNNSRLWATGKYDAIKEEWFSYLLKKRMEHAKSLTYLVDQPQEYLVEKCLAAYMEEITKANQKYVTHYTKCIDCLYAFYDGLQNRELLKNKLFEFISHDPYFMQVVSRLQCKAYMAHAVRLLIEEEAE